MTPISPPPNIASIRARARTIFKRAGLEYAQSYQSRIRGCRNWSRGTTIEAGSLDGRVEVLGWVAAHYDRREAREQDRVRAIGVLRDAGWTVDDDGRILEVPA